ncbi:right-handed parallel beta-helix repeat-containing protein [Catenulispora rubra]|uniref:right-handed parallel beta-helix repeat-containing protein n=1 Tax=Catenulispora rubra TaxID=280293 RepID=UPI001892021B|nr:right-handed parallel beta-helix repeat-containing protein [Catenulispora rubra]
MTRQILVVAPDRPEAHPSIGAALREARDGALIFIAAGTYAEQVVVDRSVTLSAEQGPGSVRICGGEQGSTLIVDAATVTLSALEFIGADEEAPILDVRRGEAVLDGCAIDGAGRMAVLAHESGTLAVRDCRIANRLGAGIVVTSAEGGVVEQTTFAEIGSSAVVVSERGRLTVNGCTIDRPVGNGIYVNRYGHADVEDCVIIGCGKPAVALEHNAGAQLARLRVSDGEGLDLYIATRAEVVVEDCDFSGSAGISVQIAGGSSPVLTECLIADPARVGVYVTGGARPRFERMQIEGAPVGIVADGASVLTFNEVDVLYAQRDAVVVSGGATAHFEGIVVEGSGDGVTASSGSEVHISGGVLKVSGAGVAVSGIAQLSLESSMLRACGASVVADASLTATDTEFSEEIVIRDRGRAVLHSCRMVSRAGEAVDLRDGEIALSGPMVPTARCEA